jgi:hypothetical protein
MISSLLFLILMADDHYGKVIDFDSLRTTGTAEGTICWLGTLFLLDLLIHIHIQNTPPFYMKLSFPCPAFRLTSFLFFYPIAEMTFPSSSSAILLRLISQDTCHNRAWLTEAEADHHHIVFPSQYTRVSPHDS